MLDIAVIRADPERIRTMLRNRNYPEDTLNEFLGLDAEWRRLMEEGNQLRRKRNEASVQVPKLKGEEKVNLLAEMKAVAQRISDVEVRVAELEQRRGDVVLMIPNQPDESVPVGGDYDHNKLILESGKVREFDFPPKDHIELGEVLGHHRFRRGTKIAGSGFYVLKGDGATLGEGLINYMLDLHRKQGYKEVFPPVVVNRNAVIGTGQYPKMKDDMYWCERDDLWLNPTAEVPVTNLLMDEILEKDQLPINYTAYLPSFRREAGRHAEMKGIIRVHEFNKVELVKFVHPNSSWAELETLLRQDAEDVLPGSGAALPSASAMHRGHGLRLGQDLRYRIARTRHRKLAGMLLMQLLHRFPGPPGPDKVPPRTAPEERVRPYAERFWRGSSEDHGVRPGEQPDRRRGRSSYPRSSAPTCKGRK